MTDVYGFTGIFFTESETDAWAFAGANTEGANDGMERVFIATIDLSEAEDLIEMEDQDEIIEAAAASNLASQDLWYLRVAAGRPGLEEDARGEPTGSFHTRVAECDACWRTRHVFPIFKFRSQSSNSAHVWTPSEYPDHASESADGHVRQAPYLIHPS